MDDIYALSGTQLSKRIGEKLKAIRLRRNITHKSISALFEEEQLSPSEYYEMVSKAKKQTRKRAAGKLKVNKEEAL